MALQALKDLEREVLHWASLTLQFGAGYPQVGPHQLRGIEINPYAAELARVTIWIGELQWMLRNGFAYVRDPILRPLDAVETRDALIDWSDPDHPVEAVWPDAEVIIGNPPFLGAKLLRRGLGNEYVETLFRPFDGRLPGMADFVCYWHEKARAMVATDQTQRVGPSGPTVLRWIPAVVATGAAMGLRRGVYRAAGRGSPSRGSCGVER